MIVLDTDVLVEMFDRNSTLGDILFDKLEGRRVTTTSINMHEIGFGFLRIGKTIPDELISLRVLPYDQEDALLSAKIEDQLENEGNLVGRFDTMIAAICINSGSQIATLNRKHFDRFKDFGLRVFELGLSLE